MNGDNNHRAGRAVEFCILFACLPLVYRAGFIPVHVILLLVIVATGCVGALLADGSFDRRLLWNPQGLRSQFKRFLGIYLICAPALWLTVTLAAPDRLYSFIRQRPVLYAVIMIFYPLASAYPQEVIYRAFLFHRYAGLFRRQWALAAASAVAFGFMHIVFGNWIAMALSAVGGVFFSVTYWRGGSTLAASVEHTLYGWLIFTIGLGGYFYNGHR